MLDTRRTSMIKTLTSAIVQHYERLCERYGHFVSDNGAVLVTNSADIR